MKWKPLEQVDLYQLLQPVEFSWKKLGRYILEKEMHYKIDTIESDCFADNRSNEALDDALAKWLRITKQEKRNWKTLYVAANEEKDASLETYVIENGFSGEFYIAIQCAAMLYLLIIFCR